MATKKVYGLKDNEIQEVDDNEAEFEMPSHTSFFSTHANLVPLQNAVQAPRIFYGARFYNQALPVAEPQAPWVQNLDTTDKQGRSFDEILGRSAGAAFVDDEDDGAEVVSVDPKYVTVSKGGVKKKISLYHNFPYNRKTAASQTPVVTKGDVLKKGQLLARSNFTDEKGSLALGVNAKVGIVPYKGFSFEDAVVISESFAKRLSSDHSNTTALDYDRDIKGGLNHYRSLFPTTYTKDQLGKMDDDGVIQEGTVVKHGDPLILATRPRVFSSTTAQLGKLSKAMRQSRHDASKVWDSEHEGVVTDVAKTRSGVKVQVKSIAPTVDGDKIVLRSGQKGVAAKIIPDDHMPRTLDGTPLEMLLNPMGIPSRANDSLIYEILMGKIAEKRGAPIKVPGFNQSKEKWWEQVQQMLDEEGISAEEEIFDPLANRKLAKPITVGNAHVLKLHHTAHCFDNETEVLTSSGWKRWEDVTDQDKLATSDVRGQRLFFEKPLHVWSFNYNGPMLGFKGRYVDYLVTPNHNMWCSQYFTKGRNFGLKQASSIHGTRFQVKQGCFDIENSQASDPITIGSLSLDWDDFSELVGWWVTEGCVSSSGSSVLIYQSKEANPKNFNRIEDLIQRLNLKYSLYTAYEKESGFSINEKDLAIYFSQFGSHCQYKTVPREIIEGPVSGADRCLEAMNLGDSSCYDNTADRPCWRFKVTSKALIDDFQELALRTGKCSIARFNKPGYKEHYLELHCASLTTSRGRSQVDGDRNDEGFYEVSYNDRVYCAEMRTGLLLVRRNGKPLLSGNSKSSARGQAGYDLNQQPLKGGSEGAQSKKLSGLEVHSMLSAGAYANLREGSTLRGQQNDEYWRALRAGRTPRPPNEPFVWDKFQALLSGAGMYARDVGDGRLRLGPFTDKDLEDRKPVEIHSGETVNLNTLDPIKDGLFDPAIVGNNKWGKIKMPFSMPNPAFETAIRHLLGLKEKELRAILAGKMELPSHLR